MRPDYAQQYHNCWHLHWWWRSRRRFVLHLIQQIACRNGVESILDIGCGDGLFFSDLMSVAPTWGVEPDASLISPSNPHRNRIDICAFSEDYRPGRAFDLIVMLDVLEHIEDDAAAMQCLQTLLVPGGRAILTVPALQLLWSQHDEANDHFRRYSRAQLCHRIVEAGLDIERLGFYFGWTVLPLILRRIVQPGRTKATERGEADYQVPIPAQPINTMLEWISSVDHALARRLPLPVGSSLFVVCRRHEID